MSKKQSPIPAELQLQAPKFKGYGMDELNYRIAMSTLQAEFVKEQIQGTFADAVEEGPFTGSCSSSIVTKMLHGLNFADYAILGFSLFRTTRNLFNFFRKKKKK